MSVISEGTVAAAADAVRAHDALLGMNYAKAGVHGVAAEWDHICAAMAALLESLAADRSAGDTTTSLRAHAGRYTSGYSFSRELDLIAETYAGDPARTRAIALKIVESLEDRGFIGLLRDVADG